MGSLTTDEEALEGGKSIKMDRLLLIQFGVL